MKSLLLLSTAVIYVHSQNYACTESNTWINLPSLPTQTGEVASAVIGDFLYVAGEEHTDTYKYSFSDNKWSQVANRVYQGNHENSFVHENGGNYYWWLVGGIDANNYGRVQVYDIQKNTWSTRDSLPWDGGSVCVVMVDDTIYACGGIVGFDNGKNGGGTNTTNKCAYYKIDSEWKMLNHMPAGRNHAATGLDNNGNMWIFGGRIGKNVPSNGFSDIQVYNTKTNTWTTSEEGKYKPMPIGRGGTGQAVYNNDKFYVFGGETRNGPGATSNLVYNRTDIYDVNSNSWSKGKDMPYPRHGIFPVLYKNAIYIAAGGPHNGHYVSSTFDKYCI